MALFPRIIYPFCPIIAFRILIAILIKTYILKIKTMIPAKIAETLIYAAVRRDAHKRGVVANRLPLLHRNHWLSALNSRFRNVNDQRPLLANMPLRDDALANKRKVFKINVKTMLLYLADTVGEGLKQYFLGNDINMEYLVICLRVVLIRLSGSLNMTSKLSVQVSRFNKIFIAFCPISIFSVPIEV